MNVSAGIGVIGAASPMLQEIVRRQAVRRRPSRLLCSSRRARKRYAAAVAAGFVGLFSLFNIGGRFFWASLSDKIGRKATYFIFFVLGIVCYGAPTSLANAGMLGVFVARSAASSVDVRRRLRDGSRLSRRHVRHAISSARSMAGC